MNRHTVERRARVEGANGCLARFQVASIGIAQFCPGNGDKPHSCLAVIGLCGVQQVEVSVHIESHVTVRKAARVLVANLDQPHLFNSGCVYVVAKHFKVELIGPLGVAAKVIVTRCWIDCAGNI